MASVKEIVARNVKIIRQFRNMSQAELAEAIDVSTGYIGVIETGKKFPSADVLQRLSEALDVRPFRLFQGEEDIHDAQDPEQIYMIRRNVEKSVQSALDKTFANLAEEK